MKLSNWKKNISATKYYARVRPKKVPEMLKKAMKLTDAEVEEYFGETLQWSAGQRLPEQIILLGGLLLKNE